MHLPSVSCCNSICFEEPFQRMLYRVCSLPTDVFIGGSKFSFVWSLAGTPVDLCNFAFTEASGCIRINYVFRPLAQKMHHANYFIETLPLCCSAFLCTAVQVFEGPEKLLLLPLMGLRLSQHFLPGCSTPAGSTRKKATAVARQVAHPHSPPHDTLLVMAAFP